MGRIVPSQLAKSGTEDAHQTAYFCWCTWQVAQIPELAFAFAVPNGGLRDPITASKLKAQGVKRGVPDIVLPVVRFADNRWYAGAYIELKKLKGGNERDADQLKWAAFLKSQGYAHYLCRGYLAAIDATKHYMGQALPWCDEQMVC